MSNFGRFVVILTLLVGAYGCSAQSSEKVGAIPLAVFELEAEKTDLVGYLLSL